MNRVLKLSQNNIINNCFMSDKKKKYFIDNFINIFVFEKEKTKLYFCISDKNIKKYMHLVEKIFKRIGAMRMIYNNNKYLEVWIYPSRFKKLFPKNNKIHYDNINSGSTVRLVNSNKNGVISIWRKEELLKVLLHEILHAFRIDDNYPSPQEAHTEFYALLLNIYMTLLENNKPISKFDKYLAKEKEFSLNQCHKLRNYNPGNTNANAYFNEKTRLLFDIDEEQWDKYINENKTSKKYASNNSLRMTISDII